MGGEFLRRSACAGTSRSGVLHADEGGGGALAQGLEPKILRGRMKKLLVGNAPCSWGSLEFDESKGEQVSFNRMLDELVETGYTGTELGDWGYMPTDPATLSRELSSRALVMLGAFVPVALKHVAAHAAGIATAIKTARLLAAVATTPSPYLILADDNGSDPIRTRIAGRVTAESRLNSSECRF